VNAKMLPSGVRFEGNGGASVATATVIDVGDDSASAGMTTLAPATDTVPPAGPTETVDDCVTTLSAGASGADPSLGEDDAGDDEHAATKIAALATASR